MNRVDPRLLAILACVLAVGLLAVFLGHSADRDRAELRKEVADLQGQVKQTALPEERIVKLPDDGGAWYVSLFVSPNWKSRPVERETVSWFYSHPVLNGLRCQVHWHLYTTDSDVYRERFKSHIGDAVPALLITDQRGKTVYCGSRAGFPAGLVRASYRREVMPDDPAVLVGRLRDLFRRFRDRCGPQPAPTPPTPPEPPTPDEGENEIVPPPGPPDIGQDEAEEAAFPTGLLVLVLVITGLGTAAVCFFRDM